MGVNRIQGDPPVEWKPGQPQDPKRRSEPVAPIADHVEISEQTQEVMRVRKLVDAAPEIRQDRVNRLQREIAQGTYQVSSETVADAIVQEHQIDLTAL